jgi:hypothetical protein
MNTKEINTCHPAKQEVLRDVANLSSGTMANLTHKNEYKDLDRIQNMFFEFSINSDIIFNDWTEAWKLFLDDHSVSYDAQGKTNNINSIL